jgi:hypothetical protein
VTETCSSYSSSSVKFSLITHLYIYNYNSKVEIWKRNHIQFQTYEITPAYPNQFSKTKSSDITVKQDNRPKVYHHHMFHFNIKEEGTFEKPHFGAEFMPNLPPKNTNTSHRIYPQKCRSILTIKKYPVKNIPLKMIQGNQKEPKRSQDILLDLFLIPRPCPKKLLCRNQITTTTTSNPQSSSIIQAFKITFSCIW